MTFAVGPDLRPLIQIVIVPLQIPSLDGALYKFDGEGIDPIAVSADSLLHTPYQESDDLLITGK